MDNAEHIKTTNTSYLFVVCDYQIHFHALIYLFSRTVIMSIFSYLNDKHSLQQIAVKEILKILWFSLKDKAFLCFSSVEHDNFYCKVL